MTEPITPDYLLLGEILRPHGIRGELRMKILTDYPERINDLESVYFSSSPAGDDAKTYHVEHLRMHKGYGLLKLTEIKDRNDADLMRGLFVLVRIDDAVPLEDDEFYLYQLIGLLVRTEDNKHIGRIIEVIETGANDVYVVKSPQHGELLIPVIDETIIETNIEDGFIIVRIPEGLIPNP